MNSSEDDDQHMMSLQDKKNQIQLSQITLVLTEFFIKLRNGFNMAPAQTKQTLNYMKYIFFFLILRYFRKQVCA